MPPDNDKGHFGRKSKVERKGSICQGMSGLVNSIRGLPATSERLRSDHILTLELFQATVDENAQLKDELSRLRARQSAEGLLGEEDGDADGSSSKKDSGAALVQKVLKQEKELTELRASVKTLKAQGVQDQMTITRLTKSNLSNEGLKKQLDEMLRAEREREAREAAENQKIVEKEPVVELHDHNECLETISALHAKMLATEEGHTKIMMTLQDEIVKLTGNNSSLMETRKSLTEDNEELKEKLSRWETKFSMAMKANEQVLRASQEKAHLAELQVASSQQQGEDLSALQDELHTERQARHELELKNSDLARQLKEAQEALKLAQQGNPLLLPATEGTGTGGDGSSSFFMTGSQSTPRLVEAVGLAQPQAQASHFEEYVKLKKENKALRAELTAAKKNRGPLGGAVVPKAR